MKNLLISLLLIISNHLFSQSYEDSVIFTKGYDKMYKLYKSDKFEKAVEIGEDLLYNKQISNKSAYKFYIQYLLGLCYYNLKKYKKSNELLDELLTIDGSPVRKEDYNQMIAAIDDLKKAMSSIPSSDTSQEDVASKSNTQEEKINSITSNAEAGKNVNLIVNGTGKTLEEAKTTALRSALEQAFGAFISSKTEILNDNLIKDEIISVSNGNIQKYDIISQIEVPGVGYAVTLNATVSISKLTSFVESKGFSAEFKGSLFAFNINQRILNEQNELKAIKSMWEVIKPIAKRSFDYKVNIGNPLVSDDSNKNWKLPIQVVVIPNENFFKITKYIFDNLQSLSLSKVEAADYLRNGKWPLPISMAIDDYNKDYFLLRNKESLFELMKHIYALKLLIFKFKLDNGISEIKSDDPSKLKNLDYTNFKILTQGRFAGVDLLFTSIFGNDESKPDLNNFPYKYDFTDLVQIRNYMHDHWYRFDKTLKSFEFLKELESEMLTVRKDKENPDEISEIVGQLLTFTDIKKSNPILIINYEDRLSLDEIKKIQEYKVVSVEK